MDDLLTRANDEMSAIMIQRRITETLQKGGFKFRKWSSNAKNVLKAIPENERESTLTLNLNVESNIKTLGRRWFTFRVQLEKYKTQPTKRLIIAKIYDPIGWLQPVIIRGKILIQ